LRGCRPQYLATPRVYVIRRARAYFDDNAPSFSWGQLVEVYGDLLLGFVERVGRIHTLRVEAAARNDQHARPSRDGTEGVDASAQIRMAGVDDARDAIARARPYF